jgi:mycofactocin system glycosyltransferase
LASTLATIGDVSNVIVVDDGSTDDAVARAGEAAGATVVRHPRSRGPGAARNTGWQRATTDLVAFVDADCQLSPGWLEGLLPHFDDPHVVAVAPRIVTTVPTSLPRPLAEYETVTPSLDRGPAEALVRPRSKVPFVPTATLVVRRGIYNTLGGFDESMPVGEDVDFVWRVDDSGGTVRYEPAVTVSHAARPDVGSWIRQRFEYGTSAAPLARRHPRAVAPVAVSPWSALAWGLVGVGAPIPGAAVAAGTTALLVPRLAGLERPWPEALGLAGKGHLYAGLSIAAAVRRPWWPLAALAAVTSRRARVCVAAAVVVPALLEWRTLRPPIDPLRWTLLRLADDVVYGAGVWRGCLRERSVAALLPDLRSWPGRADAIESAAADVVAS